MTDQYQKLKEVIQKANPEIMELKFGCEISNGEEVRTIVRDDKAFWYYQTERGMVGKFNSNAFPFKKKDRVMLAGRDWFILGRPIRLSDVLWAINKYVKPQDGIAIPSEGWIENEACNKLAQWDLTKDLDHQSGETIEFLEGIL